MTTSQAPAPTPDAAPVRPGGTMSSAAFWRLVDRLQPPDAEALELIALTGKIGPSGQRPRYRLSTRQALLASYLPVIEAALQAIGQATACGMFAAPAVCRALVGCRENRRNL